MARPGQCCVVGPVPGRGNVLPLSWGRVCGLAVYGIAVVYDGDAVTEDAERPQGLDLRVLPCSILSTEAGRIWVARGGGSGGGVPPHHEGPRTSQILSRRGARTLQDSSYLAFTSGRGFCTHWTFTMSDEARDMLRDGELVLSREIRRTLNAVQTRLRREGHAPLSYQWVAENPDRSHGFGGTNPHVHLNCDLTIPQTDFKAWCAWVEAVWSHGMVHQERLKDPRAAAAYLLKCVGYVSKGKQWGQGEIKGARYGVSKGLRPEVTRWDVDDSDGRMAQGLANVCASAPGAGVVQVGRGVFATRYGVGCNPLSGASIDDVIRLVRRRGNWVKPEVIDVSSYEEWIHEVWGDGAAAWQARREDARVAVVSAALIADGWVLEREEMSNV